MEHPVSISPMSQNNCSSNAVFLLISVLFQEYYQKVQSGQKTSNTTPVLNLHFSFFPSTDLQLEFFYLKFHFLTAVFHNRLLNSLFPRETLNVHYQ